MNLSSTALENVKIVKTKLTSNLYLITFNWSCPEADTEARNCAMWRERAASIFFT